jgi:phosphatidylserine decarboxylase
MSLLKATLTNSASRLFGKIASKKFPSLMQLGINKLYTSITGVDLSMFHPHGHYETLNALFTRELRFKRDISKDPKSIISPADSLISAQGEIEASDALQIKGFSYNIRELLTEHISNEHIEKMIGGEFINFYLSPMDYHRYHVPMDMQVLKAIHVPGLLYPVNFKYLKKVPSLFVKNERVILECKDTNDKLFYMVLVGALNVGKMTLSFDERIETNVESSLEKVYEYEDIHLKKGEELGMFMMGSTIVMLFEQDFVDLLNKQGKSVRFGEVIASKH